MKRLPTTHRKTPVSKEDKAPDFYEMSKISPLPEVTISKPAPTLYNGSLHPMGSGYFPSAAAVGGAVAAAAASVGATATAAASVDATATAAQEENADTKDKKQDDATAMLEQNMRLSNELLRRQLLELQQRENGGMSLLPGGQQYPRSTAEAEARMNHQLMQMQRERFQQVQKEQSEMDQQQKEVASKTVKDTQPVELNTANGDAVKEEEGKAPDTSEDDKKEGAKVSPMVKDLIARYKDKKDVEI